MTTEEKGAKIIDELLVLFSLYQEDYHIIDDALNYIAEISQKNPSHPITMSLANYMREKGLLE